MKLPVAFERYRAEVNAEMQSALKGRRLPLYDMMRYHLGWVDEKGTPLPDAAGKAIRPILCLLACEAVGGEYHRALPAAAAIELVHNYSLIHDDIQDDDQERRHRQTVWSIWGKPQAINAGTGMRLLAGMALWRLRELGVSTERQLRVQRLIDEATLALIEGQYLDISFENRFDIGVADYIDMVGSKTATLIACSMETGALLGTEDESMVKQFRDVGHKLGLAFQIKDDILGIWGCETVTGKPMGSDIEHHKKSLPIVYVLGNSKNGLKKELIDIYRKKSLDKASVASVSRILEAIGAQQNCQKMADDYCHQALKAIDKLTLIPAVKNNLKEITHFLMERDF